MVARLDPNQDPYMLLRMHLRGRALEVYRDLQRMKLEPISMP
jgi:hypothetical protein